MGLGQFGGGVGTTQWLAAKGARVLLTDTASRAKLARSLEALQPLIDRGAVHLRLGEHRLEDFESADLVVANPAVARPWENEFLLAARASGVPVTTEIRLCVDQLNRARTVAVTGSAGKSSTSAMLAHLLQLQHEGARLGGNIGGSMLGDLPAHQEWTVLELSSAMLWWLGQGAAWAGKAPWSPAVAVLTNLAPNHVDWHGSLDHYYRSKADIRAGQRAGDTFVSLFGFEQPAAAAGAQRVCARAWWHWAEQPTHDALQLLLEQIELPLAPGKHQRRNARLAILAAEAAIQSQDNTPECDAQLRAQMIGALRQFRALPHRLEFVGEFRGLKCFNDSKSTTPDATLLAVAAFPEPKRIHLIAGGYDKKVDLSAIKQLAPLLAGLYAIGTTAPLLAASPADACGTLENAVKRAAERAQPGDVLLLSPACASMDQFVNYEARGEAFSQLVRAL
jgi:UDP-N-acetylmuramoylalanine--D-glutamate ligase